MIFPCISPEKWIERYPELRVINKKCDHCGFMLFANRPFLEKGYAGLKADECLCGYNRHTIMTFVTTTTEKQREWEML